MSLLISGFWSDWGQSISDDFESLFPRHLRVASTREFVRWLRDMCETYPLSLRKLLSLYVEFCEVTERRPLSTRQLLNRIKDHGVETRRPSAAVVGGRMHRPTTYQVRPQKPKRL